MATYQELRGEVALRVNSREVLDKVIDRLILVERKRLNNILGRGNEPEYDSEYARKMKIYIHAKLYAHRQRRDNDGWMYHINFGVKRSTDADKIAHDARIDALEELKKY
jgi:hypothetical protein